MVILYDSDLTRNAWVIYSVVQRLISEPNMNRKSVAHQVTPETHSGCLKCYLGASRQIRVDCTCQSAVAVFQRNEKVESEGGILQ